MAIKYDLWAREREAATVNDHGLRVLVTDSVTRGMSDLDIEWAQVSNPDTCPNLRDFYPDYDRFMAAVNDWHRRKADVLARLNANLAARIAATRIPSPASP